MKKIIVLRNTMRVLGITSALVTALSFGAGIAKANIDFSGGNNTTGPNSENENSWDIDSHINVDVTNHSLVDNDQSFQVKTGDTEINQNTQVGDLTTGDIRGDIEVDNRLNTGDIHLMSMDPGNINFDINNDTTGPNSENENKVSIDVNRNVDISNCANIDNDLSLRLNSGDNDINHNTVVGDIQTGDVRFDATVKNIANGSMGDISLGGMDGLSASGNLSNSLTGPNSENENKVDINSNADINIHNSANIDNEQTFNANTGDNNIDHNTVVGDITTGGVQIDVSTTNTAN